MNKLILLFISLLPLLCNSQEWFKTLGNRKSQIKNLEFYEIQKAFNDFHVENGTIDGTKNEGGIIIKVPGWNNYKRWEWFWETRINRKTGEFPQNTILSKIQTKESVTNVFGNWSSLGAFEAEGGWAGIGRINCIAFHHSDTNIFWVGTPSGGLWHTSDGGLNWNPLADNNSVLGVSDIAIPSNYATSNTIYIATGDKNSGSLHQIANSGGSGDNSSVGILKSTDGGLNWTTTGFSTNINYNILIGRLLINPNNNNTLLAAYSNGIKKSVDKGLTWDEVYSFGGGYPGDLVIDMEFKPNDTSVIYASTKDYKKAPKIIKSTDGGKKWIEIKKFSITDHRVEIAVSKANNEIVFAIVANVNGGLTGIYKSNDAGESFIQLVDGSDSGKALLNKFKNGSGDNIGQGGYDLCIAISPFDSNVVVIGGINTWRTTDGGANWSCINIWRPGVGLPNVHADKHTLNFRNDGKLFEGNDGGIYKSANDGTDWVDISKGLAIGQIYRLGVCKQDSNIILTGLQDNGTKLLNKSKWKTVTSGDGMECIIDYTDTNIQYASYVNGIIYRTDNNWDSKAIISDSIPGGNAGAWVTPFVIDPHNNNVLYVGYADIWKSSDKGDSFSKISDINTSGLLRSLAVAPSNSKVIYTADLDKVWKTSNGGKNWKVISGSLQSGFNSITNIFVKYDDENTIWVTLGGYDNKRIFESTNGGVTWYSISNGLPELPVMTLVQNKNSKAVVQLYAGTDIGVFVKQGSEKWQLFSQNLPNVVVTELEIYYDELNPIKSKLNAATYGRGLWKSNLFVSPVANFTANITSGSYPFEVTFTNKSSDSETYLWNFGDGNTSTEKNPSHTYVSQGNYTVSLTAKTPEITNTKTKTSYIKVTDKKVVANFNSNVVSGNFPLKVQFTDISENANSWNWNFGDKKISIDQNPIHIYEKAGTYTVELIASNHDYENTIIKTNYISVSWPIPIAKFSADPINGVNPLTVTFTDLSEYAQEWNWSFGDNSKSTEQNPQHIYSKGHFTVTLEVSNPTGKNSIKKDSYIGVDPNSIPEMWKKILSIYPIPAIEFFTVHLLNENNDKVLIELYNLQGNIVKKYESIVGSEITQNINVSNLPSGLYVLKLRIGVDELMVKITID